jgi:sulfoxide reductase heme-binding subunit YedZ
MDEPKKPRRPSWWRSPKPLVFALCLVPLVWIVYELVTNQLGANPPQTLLQLLGLWGLRFLLIGLAITPLRRFTGWNALIRYRRMLGLFAFFYVTLHFSAYLLLDQSLDWAAIIKDILKRPFILVGVLAWLLLIPLAATSTAGMQRRLGGRNWRRLHQAVYVVAMLAPLHYLMLVKSWPLQPVAYAALAVALLAVRGIFRLQRSRATS